MLISDWSSDVCSSDLRLLLWLDSTLRGHRPSTPAGAAQRHLLSRTLLGASDPGRAGDPLRTAPRGARARAPARGCRSPRRQASVGLGHHHLLHPAVGPQLLADAGADVDAAVRVLPFPPRAPPRRPR